MSLAQDNDNVIIILSTPPPPRASVFDCRLIIFIIFHYFHHVFISMTMCARVVGPSCAGYSHSGIDRGHN